MRGKRPHRNRAHDLKSYLRKGGRRFARSSLTTHRRRLDGSRTGASALSGQRAKLTISLEMRRLLGTLELVVEVDPHVPFVDCCEEIHDGLKMLLPQGREILQKLG